MPEIYTPERALYNKMHTGNPGSYNGRAKISKEEVLKIRERYKKGESILSIYQDYKDKYASVKSFKGLVKGKRYKIDS